MPEGLRCGDCRFFTDDECHRHPPVVAFGHQVWQDRDGVDQLYVHTETVWPDVKASDWCGEFELHERLTVNTEAGPIPR